MFDHTLLIAQDDPEIEKFEMLNDYGIADLRVVKDVGCECFAELVFDKVNEILDLHPLSRVRLMKVEVWEHAGNSAAMVSDFV